MEVGVLHGLFGCDSLNRIHTEQLLQQNECLCVRLDFVLLHILDQRTVCVTAEEVSLVTMNWNFPFKINLMARKTRLPRLLEIS